ncbi:ribokinase [Oceanobacillus timonensis]|uniref:ribokinase n=1 Tax=Oceanobacillus timonensis TaxID=1926285 RepID=UPI0009BB5DC5|nr:ribokinase [Oceanobacillus timonensis]
MKRNPRVCVVGSINMDMVTTTDKIPAQGETVMGESFTTYPGGKGANQAVAAARLGADVVMVGAVGEDAFGKSLKERFREEGANDEAITTVPYESTGVATIIISDGDNRIIVAPGANKYITPERLKEKEDIILSSDIILMQFEIPMEAVAHTVDLAYKHDIPVVINPAPFTDIPESVIKKVTFLTPNELELSEMEQSIDASLIKGKIIETRGEQGVAFMLTNGEKKTIPSFPAQVKDTTGAGDTFNGAFVTEYAKEKDIEKAIQFANAAASLSVEKIGAQGGMPEREAVVKRMEIK